MELLIESTPTPFIYALAILFIILVKLGIIVEGDEDEQSFDTESQVLSNMEID